ncbi:MAG: hypothetical protein IIC50_24855 [Planctomycetes bacterium]|nr:hypothetical protein [Planctomycetota bacterium]
MMTGNADIRDPTTGAPVEAIFSAHALFVSSLFAGLFTTLFCLVRRWVTIIWFFAPAR